MVVFSLGVAFKSHIKIGNFSFIFNNSACKDLLLLTHKDICYDKASSHYPWPLCELFHLYAKDASTN